jgi:prevent-host-death family protein
MEKVISASEAKRQFSRLLRDVQGGRSYLVTSHGCPVARIAAIPEKEAKVRDSPAWRRLVRRLCKQPVINIGPSTRDVLYD